MVDTEKAKEKIGETKEDVLKAINIIRKGGESTHAIEILRKVGKELDDAKKELE